MCKFILLMAFMVVNPFGFPDWVLTIAWVALIVDIIFGLFNLVFGS